MGVVGLETHDTVERRDAINHTTLEKVFVIVINWPHHDSTVTPNTHNYNYLFVSRRVGC